MIGLIVAYDKNRVIGSEGKIPWNIEGEKKRFKDLTTGNVVIMGRKTYEEIGHPLPNRTTIVVSNTKNFDTDGCFTAKSLTEALKMASNRDVYIAGGSRLYKEALDLVDVMYITEIDASFKGDTYFPSFDESQFDKVIVSKVEGEIPYQYISYIRKPIK